MGYPAESVELYERGLEAKDGDRTAAAEDLFRRAFEGTALDREGDEDAAVAWFRRAVQEAGDATAANKLGEVYRRRGDLRRSEFRSTVLLGLREYSPGFEAFGAAVSAAAIHRQDVLNEALGDGYDHYDLHARTLSVGDRTFHGVTYPGSFSHLDRSVVREEP